MVEAILASATLLLVISVLTEAVTELVKTILPEGLIRDRITYVVALIVGIVLAYALDLNLFGTVGFSQHVGTVLGGIIASRGANFVNGFLKKFDIVRTVK